jgi:drug/metabolite transporter (DMT)-like permease
MDLAVTGVVLLSAVLHASWNALAHAIRDQLVGFVLMGVAMTVCAVAALPFVAPPDRSSWPFLVGSGITHVAYNLLLWQSYRVGEFNQVYPLARGTSPLVVAVVAVTLVGEHLSAVQFAGVFVVSAGLAGLVLVGGLPKRDQRPALLAAAATGLAIAAYTVMDGVGVRRSGSVVGYSGWLFLLQGPAIPLIAFALRGRGLGRQLGPHVWAGLAAGVLSMAAYGLVLWAQTRGALAPIAALRETSVIFGAIIATLVFREPFGRARIAATVLVAAGIVLLNVT